MKEEKKTETHLISCENSKLLIVKTFNIQKTNILEKGIGILAIKRQFIRAIRKHFKSLKFDLILYPTPPITLFGVVKYFKKRDNAKTYLMLKDIFPQNAVDIGLMNTSGFGGYIYKYFRKQEKRLYHISDKIGCMSPANVEYVLKHNPELALEKVEVFPNCIEFQTLDLTDEEQKQCRIKYELPSNRKIFVYGGNLGKPQDIPFIIELLKAEKNNENVFFLVIGDGTEYKKMEQYMYESEQKNFKLLRKLPTDEFDKVLCVCDIGLIFLDHRFTIPNFPSRLLSYMQAGLPVLACTDHATDIGKIIVEGEFGWSCHSDQLSEVIAYVDKASKCDKIQSFKENSRKALNNYSVEKWVSYLLNEA